MRTTSFGLVLFMAAACGTPDVGGSSSALVGQPTLFSTPLLQTVNRIAPDRVVSLGGAYLRQVSDVRYEQVSEWGEQVDVQASSSDTAQRGAAEILYADEDGGGLQVRFPAAVDADAVYMIAARVGREWVTRTWVGDARPIAVAPLMIPSFGGSRDVVIYGRNLRAVRQVRFEGPALFKPPFTVLSDQELRITLPFRIPPGTYDVAVNLSASETEGWVESTGMVAEAPHYPLRTLSMGDFACRPDDGEDDTACLCEALRGADPGGEVVVPEGRWVLEDLGLCELGQPMNAYTGVIIPAGVSLRGEPGAILSRGERWTPRALITLHKDTTISGVEFTRERLPTSLPHVNTSSLLIGCDVCGEGATRIRIDRSRFMNEWRAIMGGALPQRHITIADNVFASLSHAVNMQGDANPNRWKELPAFYMADLNVVRNHFISASDLEEVPLAMQLDGVRYGDVSDNVVDGATPNPATGSLGFRGGFFWAMNGNFENVRVAGNEMRCTADRAPNTGSGEAFQIDGNHNIFPWRQSEHVLAVDRGVIEVPSMAQLRDRVTGEPRITEGSPEQFADYYSNHWIMVTHGPGRGQARRISGVTYDEGRWWVRVAVAWDVVPEPGLSRVLVGRTASQQLVMRNSFDESPGLCQHEPWREIGSSMGTYGHSTDVLFADNEMRHTSGVVITGRTDFPVFRTEIVGNAMLGRYFEGECDGDCEAGGGISLRSRGFARFDRQPLSDVLFHSPRIADNRMERAYGEHDYGGVASEPSSIRIVNMLHAFEQAGPHTRGLVIEGSVVQDSPLGVHLMSGVDGSVLVDNDFSDADEALLDHGENTVVLP